MALAGNFGISFLGIDTPRLFVCKTVCRKLPFVLSKQDKRKLLSDGNLSIHILLLTVKMATVFILRYIQVHKE
ncbi:MAG TPA: hypothetical protein VIO58_13580 [Candidatus Methanoperedens sp.]